MPAQSDNETGTRFGIGARASARAATAQRADHAVEQLEHGVVAQRNRLRPAGGARGELHDRLARLDIPQPAQPRRLAPRAARSPPRRRSTRSTARARRRARAGSAARTRRPHSTRRTTPRSRRARSVPAPRRRGRRVPSTAAGRPSRRPTIATRRASVAFPSRYTTTSAGSPSMSSPSDAARGDPPGSVTARSRRAGAGRSPRAGGRSASGSAARRPSTCDCTTAPIASSWARQTPSEPSSHARSNAAQVSRSGTAQITIASVSEHIATRNAPMH